MKKAFIIQNFLAPYRLPLFEKISGAADFEVTLVLMENDHPSYPQWRQDRLSLPYRVLKMKQAREDRMGRTSANLRLLSLLLRERPDVVYCSGFSFSTPWVCLYKLISRQKLVIWMEGNAITERHRRFPSFRSIIRRFMARYADGFIEAGSLSRAYVENLLPENSHKPIFRSYNCIDSPRFRVSCNAYKASDDYKRVKATKYPELNIVFSGRLIQLKGIHLMLEVYQEVLKRMEKPVGLIILGQGELRSYIETVCKEKGLDQVFLEGFINQDEYPKYFALADVFLLLSHYDCNPLVIFEALSCGLPIVCSDRVGNAPDFVTKKNGYVVDISDKSGIVGCIVDILSNKELRNNMGRASLYIVKKANYFDSAMAFVNIFHKLSGKIEN